MAGSTFSQGPPDFTKGQVNRAGQLLLHARERLALESEAAVVADLGEDRLSEAWEALTWWRSLHARPLSAVAANLRYHVDQADGRAKVGSRSHSGSSG
jgi:hypothetical protein